ncbi:MAG: HAD hydrolase-like protein [Magnetococcales bacterium]|nr:HAD hydrolase-like protein [Magnetococcales bacterium]
MNRTPHPTFSGLEAVVFDLDGTLIDSLPDVLVAINRLLSSDGGRAPLTLPKLRTMVGHGAAPMIEMAYRATGSPLPDDATLQAAVTRYLEFYKSDPASHTIVYPGVPETLTALKSEGILLGICTNKPFLMTNLVLEALNLAHHFCGLTGGDNVPNPKPDADHINRTMTLMNCVSRCAVMVGDSGVDCAAGRNAGLPVVGVTYGYHLEKSPAALDADRIIDHFSQLPDALSALVRESTWKERT